MHVIAFNTLSLQPLGKQTDTKKLLGEKHRYSQQSPQSAESFAPSRSSNSLGSGLQWARSSGLHGKKAYKSINMGGRSPHDPLQRHNGTASHLHSAQNHQTRPRVRTYSDTSIMSEHPSELSCSNASDSEARHPSSSLRRPGRQGGVENSLDAELNSTYISRQAVESVLNLQRLQKQRFMTGSSVNPGSRTSSSSLESFENSMQMREKGSDCPDGACRRRDSGNWSGDRNSASSASSTSLDGSYYYIAGAKRTNVNTGRTINNFSKHEYMNVGMFADQGYDSYSLSSTDSYPSAGQPGSPAKQDPRLKQIPEASQVPDSLESAIHHSLLQANDPASDAVFEDGFAGNKCRGMH